MRKPTDCPQSLKIHPSLKPFFGYRFKKLALILQTAQNEALAPLKLSPIHVGIMVLLKAAGTMNQVSLGDELGIDKATMVKIIDALEKNKCVARTSDDSDRRVKLIQLTAKGRETLEKSVKLMSDVRDNFLSPLTAGEKEALEKIFMKLA